MATISSDSARPRSTPRVLEAGTFIGTVATRVETSSMVFSRMSGSVPAGEVPRHSHDTAYFFFVIRGRYATEARGATDACGPMSVIFNPTGTTHRDHFLDDEGQFLAVGIPSNIEREIDSVLPVSTLLHDPRVTSTMRAACRELREPGSTTAFALEALGLQLVALCRPNKDPTFRRPPMWLARVRGRLHEESAREITVASVAADVGVHPIHLARVFRHYLGCSPGEYIRACRIERARRLLGQSTLRISDVAQAAGFYDQSQLANAFKRTTGLRPSQYRARFCR